MTKLISVAPLLFSLACDHAPAPREAPKPSPPTATQTALDPVKAPSPAPPNDERARQFQLELAARLFQHSLRVKPAENIRFSPLALLLPPEPGRSLSWLGTAAKTTPAALLHSLPASPWREASPKPDSAGLHFELELSRPIRHYQRNFQGLDGRQSPLGLYYSEKASQSAELKEAVGTFRVFDFPLRNPTLELRYVELPRVSAQKLADATDVSLLKALLSIALTETRAAIFPAPPVDTTENLQKKLSELAGSDAPPDIKFVDHFRFRLNHTGPLTAVKHVRNPKRLGRPGWFFLKDRKTSELLAAVGLHSVPSND